MCWNSVGFGCFNPNLNLTSAFTGRRGGCNFILVAGVHIHLFADPRSWNDISAGELKRVCHIASFVCHRQISSSIDNSPGRLQPLLVVHVQRRIINARQQPNVFTALFRSEICCQGSEVLVCRVGRFWSFTFTNCVVGGFESKVTCVFALYSASFKSSCSTVSVRPCSETPKACPVAWHSRHCT